MLRRQRAGPLLVSASITFALAILGLCGSAFGRQPDVYVLLVDTLRADHLPMYGYARPTAPALEQFSKSALVFEHVTSTASWTLPAVGSLFTSTYPTAHGLLAHGIGPLTVRSLRPGVVSLPELFQKAGYYTAAICANVWLRAANQTGLDRGFDHYFVQNRLPAKEVNRQAQEVLQQHADRPVFLYLHYMEPHGPYDAPELPPNVLGPVPGPDTVLREGQVPHARRMVYKTDWRDDEGLTLAYYVDAYDRTIHLWDQAFGEFIKWLESQGRLDRSWVVVVSDHGEELLERGGWNHGTSLFEEQAVIPWILRAPQGKLRGRISDPVSLIDVAPTLLAATGLSRPNIMEGIDARKGAPHRLLFAEVDSCRGTWTTCHQRAVWDDRKKLLLHYKRWRTYDLRTDPGEQSPGPPDEGLTKAVEEWESANQKLAKKFGEPSSQTVDSGVRERLRALGY